MTTLFPQSFRSSVMAGICLAVIAVAHPAYGASPRSPEVLKQDLSRLLAMPFANDMVGAKDAPVIAWVENRGGARNVLVSQNGKSPKLLTHYTRDDGILLWDLALSRNGRIAAYVENGDPEYPDGAPPNAGLQNNLPKQNVHVVLPSGQDVIAGQGHSPAFSPDGKMLAFSEGGTLFQGRVAVKAAAVLKTVGSIEALKWSADGTRLLFSLRRGTHSLIGLFTLSGAGNGKLEFIDPAFAHDVLPEFSPDGSKIAFVRSRAPLHDDQVEKGSFWSLHVYDLKTQTGSEVWKAPSGQGGRFAASEGMSLIWADDTHLLFPWEGSGWMRVYELDLAHAATPRALMPDNAEVSSYCLDSDRQSLIYTSNAGDLDASYGWSQSLLGGAPVRIGHGNKMQFSVVPAGHSIAFMETGVEQTAHPVVLNGKSDLETPVEPVLPAGIKFVTPQNVHFKSADGTDLHGQVFLPPSGSDARKPALLFLHGGPKRQMLPAFNPMDYYSNAYLMNQTLASDGYVVMTVNYRSGTGYGEGFRNALHTGDRGASEYQDVLAAASYLQHRSDVNPHKIGVWGGSWGGYLTALSLARNSDIFAAGADFHGVHDLTDPSRMGLSPDENQAKLETAWRSSPAASIQNWRSPVLLVHGDDDWNVDFSQSVILSRLLSEQGVAFQEHSFPNERHTFLRNQDWESAYLWMIEFFSEQLK